MTGEPTTAQRGHFERPDPTGDGKPWGSPFPPFGTAANPNRCTPCLNSHHDRCDGGMCGCLHPASEWERERADAAAFMGDVGGAEPDVDPAKRYNARERALNLAVVLGIHEQSAAFVHLVRELRKLERIDELTVGKLHLGPKTLGRVRAVVES